MSSKNEHTHATEGNLHSTEEHHAPHAMSWQVLVGVWLVLMFFTAVTIGAAYLPLHSDFWRAAIAIGVASIKATIVALFFMHLLYDEKFNLVVLISSVLFVIIFFAFTLMDPLSRGWINPISEFPIKPKMDRPGSMLENFHEAAFKADAAGHSTTDSATMEHGAAEPASEEGHAAPAEHGAPAHGEAASH